MNDGTKEESTEPKPSEVDAASSIVLTVTFPLSPLSSVSRALSRRCVMWWVSTIVEALSWDDTIRKNIH